MSHRNKNKTQATEGGIPSPVPELRPVPTWGVRFLDFYQPPLSKCLAKAGYAALMIRITVPT